MADPLNAAEAVARLEQAQGRFRVAEEERRQAILAAVRAEVSLRDVARAAACSHESVRRIVAADGAVVLELDQRSYPLTRQQAEMLIYKLAGSARGAFPRDLELLGAGSDWLPAAAELAGALQAAISNPEAASVELESERGLALYQVLRLTYTGGRTTLARLYDDLREIYASGEPHVIAALDRAKPRKR